MKIFFVQFFKQKTAYEMNLCDWSSDVCSSDLKLTFSSSVATAEFSKFAGILGAALSQHHLSDRKSVV